MGISSIFVYGTKCCRTLKLHCNKNSFNGRYLYTKEEKKVFANEASSHAKSYRSTVLQETHGEAHKKLAIHRYFSLSGSIRGASILLAVKCSVSLDMRIVPLEIK